MLTKNCVSVIIPNFNNSQWLESCIQSCIDQGEYLKEIIFVDDRSTDTSLEIANSCKNKYPGIIQVYSNPSKGANAARNFGFSKSTGDFIQWLDSDDRIVPGKFKYQLDAFKNNDIDIVYSDWRMDFYENGNFVKKEIRKSRVYDDYLYELIKDNWTSPNNYLLTRELAQKLHEMKSWNPDTKVSQDREYFTYAALIGAKFKYVPGTFCIYNRWSDKSISSMAFKKRIELNQVLERNIRQEIEKRIKGKKLKQYLKVMNTFKVKAKFYHNATQFERIVYPWSLNWNLIQWKMRFVIPLILLSGNFGYLFKAGKN